MYLMQLHMMVQVQARSKQMTQVLILVTNYLYFLSIAFSARFQAIGQRRLALGTFTTNPYSERTVVINTGSRRTMQNIRYESQIAMFTGIEHFPVEFAKLRSSIYSCGFRVDTARKDA